MHLSLVFSRISHCILQHILQESYSLFHVVSLRCELLFKFPFYNSWLAPFPSVWCHVCQPRCMLTGFSNCEREVRRARTDAGESKVFVWLLNEKTYASLKLVKNRVHCLWGNRVSHSMLWCLFLNLSTIRTLNYYYYQCTSVITYNN